MVYSLPKILWLKPGHPGNNSNYFYMLFHAAEPVLTCVQCQEQYIESQNDEGHCKYHPSPSVNCWAYYTCVIFVCYHSLNIHRYECCNQQVKDTDSSKHVPGCKNGKHCSEHHDNYPYAAYATFIRNEVSIMHDTSFTHATEVTQFDGMHCNFCIKSCIITCKYPKNHSSR